MRIVIATSDDIIYHGLKSILISDERVSSIYEAKNIETLRYYLNESSLDLFLIDQEMIHELVDCLSKKIIIFTMDPSLSVLQTAYKNKARAYFSVHASKDIILRSLDNSLDFILDPSLSSWVMPYLNSSTQYSLEDIHLTKREQEVEVLFRAGLSRRAIAERLVISEATVKSHLKSIVKKRAKINY